MRIKEHGKVREDTRIRFLYGCGEMAVEVILAQIGVDEEQQAVGLAVCAACLKQG